MRIAARTMNLIAGMIIILSLLRQVLPQQESTTSGYIDSFRGSAYIQMKGAEERPLRPRRDQRLYLHAGDKVRCDPGSSLRICIYGNAGARCHDVPPSVAYPLPFVSSGKVYGIRAGRERAGTSPVFSPSDRSTVRPASLVIRWIPRAALRTFSLKIQDTANSVLWQQRVSDGKRGFLISDSLRQMLVKYRDEVRTGRLTLKVLDQEGVETRITFSLLTKPDEQELDQSLALLDKEPEIFMRHLGRIETYTSRGMVVEVAEEYEMALTETPESTDVLIDAILAHQRTGNSARREELLRRLPPDTKLPW